MATRQIVTAQEAAPAEEVSNPSPLITSDLDDLLTRPYNPADYQSPDTGQWYDFDMEIEGKVVLNDFQNSRQSPIGLWRLLSQLVTDDTGPAPTLTFTAPLVKTGTTVTLDTGDGTRITAGKLTVVPSADAGNLIKQGTDKELFYKTA